MARFVSYLEDHLGHGIGAEVLKDHPVLQWLAWWSASVLKRVAVKSHGRTVFEHTVGHRMKTPLCAFGESFLYRTKRHIGALNKYDSEWTDGIFLGVSGLGVSVLVRLQTFTWWKAEQRSRARSGHYI